MPEPIQPLPEAISSRDVEQRLSALVEFDFPKGIILIRNRAGLAELYSRLLEKNVLDDSVRDLRRRIGGLLECADTDQRADWGFFMLVRTGNS